MHHLLVRIVAHLGVLPLGWDYGLRTPDELICATAVLGAAVIVGNDEMWKRIGSLAHYIHVDDLVAAADRGDGTDHDGNSHGR